MRNIDWVKIFDWGELSVILRKNLCFVGFLKENFRGIEGKNTLKGLLEDYLSFDLWRTEEVKACRQRQEEVKNAWRRPESVNYLKLLNLQFQIDKIMNFMITGVKNCFIYVLNQNYFHFSRLQSLPQMTPIILCASNFAIIYSASTNSRILILQNKFE